MKSLVNSASLSETLRLICLLPVAGSLLFSLVGNAQESAYQVPGSADGVPVLQGMWAGNTITPFPRPKEFGDKLWEGDCSLPGVLAGASLDEAEQSGRANE